MLKHLAIVVLATVVLPVDGQQNGSQTSSNEKTSNQTEWTVPCIVKQDRTAPNCDWSKAVPDSYFKRLFSPESAPNIALFVVGVAGIFVAAVGAMLGGLDHIYPVTDKNRIMMGFWWPNDEKPEYSIDCSQSNDESR